MEKFKCNWSKMFESILWCDGCCTESLCTREPLSCKLIPPYMNQNVVSSTHIFHNILIKVQDFYYIGVLLFILWQRCRSQSFCFMFSLTDLKFLKYLQNLHRISRITTMLQFLIFSQSFSWGKKVFGPSSNNGTCGFAVESRLKLLCWIMAMDANQCSICDFIVSLWWLTSIIKFTLSPMNRNFRPSWTALISCELKCPPICFCVRSMTQWDVVIPSGCNLSYTLKKKGKRMLTFLFLVSFSLFPYK